MDSNSFTQKSSEAILSARDIASQRNHQYVEPIHLLAGLLAHGQIKKLLEGEDAPGLVGLEDPEP